MIQQHKDVLPDDVIKWFKQDFESRISQGEHTVKPPGDIESLKRLYNIETCEAAEYRIDLHVGDPARELLDPYLYKYIPGAKGWNGETSNFYIAYQRQFIPQNLHVDGTSTPTNPESFTGILPLDENPHARHQTIIWEKEFQTFEEFRAYFKFTNSWFQGYYTHKWQPASYRHDIEHILESYHSANYMRVIGALNYIRGGLGLFTRTHMHCSSNWRKYPGETYKDFILIHLN